MSSHKMSTYAMLKIPGIPLVKGLQSSVLGCSRWLSDELEVCDLMCLLYMYLVF